MDIKFNVDITSLRKRMGDRFDPMVAKNDQIKKFKYENIYLLVVAVVVVVVVI